MIYVHANAQWINHAVWHTHVCMSLPPASLLNPLYIEQQHEVFIKVVHATSKGLDQPAPAHVHSLIRAFASCLNILQLLRLLIEHQLEFLCIYNAAQARLSLHLPECHMTGNHMSRLNYHLSYDVASESEITPCNKIDKLQVVYRLRETL